jgi:hypothetical protein
MVVFTRKSVEEILRAGGSAGWIAKTEEIEACEYHVCTRSRREWHEGDEPVGSAFLVGRTKHAVPSPNDSNPRRKLVLFSEYALINPPIPNVWPGTRNPLNYTTMEKLGIDPATLDFKPMPVNVEPMTIEQAKAGLAATFRVQPSQIEIAIRG